LYWRFVDPNIINSGSVDEQWFEDEFAVSCAFVVGAEGVSSEECSGDVAVGAFFSNDDGGGSCVALVEGVECWGWFAFYPCFVVGGGLCSFGFREGCDGVWASCDEAGCDWVVGDVGVVLGVGALVERCPIYQDGVVHDDVSVVGVLVDYGSVVVEAG